jgi:hypothetical protein
MRMDAHAGGPIWSACDAVPPFTMIRSVANDPMQPFDLGCAALRLDGPLAQFLVYLALHLAADSAPPVLADGPALLH